jgi:hypothetical protein
MTGATSVTGTAYPSGAPEFTSVLVGFAMVKRKIIVDKTQEIVKYEPYKNRCELWFS